VKKTSKGVLYMLSCTFDDIRRADFLKINAARSSYSDEYVYVVEVVIGGFSYELANQGFVVEFQNFVKAVEAVGGYFPDTNYSMETVFSFGESHVNMDFHCVSRPSVEEKV